MVEKSSLCYTGNNLALSASPFPNQHFWYRYTAMHWTIVYTFSSCSVSKCTFDCLDLCDRTGTVNTLCCSDRQICKKSENTSSAYWSWESCIELVWYGTDWYANEMIICSYNNRFITQICLFRRALTPMMNFGVRILKFFSHWYDSKVHRERKNYFMMMTKFISPYVVKLLWQDRFTNHHYFQLIYIIDQCFEMIPTF